MTIPILSLGTDNRTLQKALNEQAQVLEALGGCLDGQADAIKGLADNQRVLASGFQQHQADVSKEFVDAWKLLRDHDATLERANAWLSLTLYQRLRWLLTGR